MAGRRVRTLAADAACFEPMTTLGCDLQPFATGDDCVHSITDGCYYRTVDGGREVYVTGTYLPPDGPGGPFECDADAYRLRMLARGKCE